MKTAFARTYSQLLADRGHHQIWALACAVLMMAARRNCMKVAIPKITPVDLDSRAPEPVRQRR